MLRHTHPVVLRSAALLALAALGGCSAEIVAANSRVYRDRTVELYEDQLLDNLIRAYEGRPFLHIDFGDAAIEGNASAEGATSYSNNDEDSVTIGGEKDGLTATDKDGFNISGKLTIGDKVTQKVKIARKNRWLYEQYLAAAHAGVIEWSSSSEPDAGWVMARPGCSPRHGGAEGYYYVPSGKRNQALDLMMQTSVLQTETTPETGLANRSSVLMRTVVARGQPMSTWFDAEIVPEIDGFARGVAIIRTPQNLTFYAYLVGPPKAPPAPPGAPAPAPRPAPAAGAPPLGTPIKLMVPRPTIDRFAAATGTSGDVAVYEALFTDSVIVVYNAGGGGGKVPLIKVEVENKQPAAE